MESVVVLVRICGNVFAMKRVGGQLRVVKIGTYRTRPPDQREAIKLLRGR